MLIDGPSLPDGVVLRADLAIVGAGPAGLTVGLEVAATGASVIILESGGLDLTASPALRAAESVGHPYAVARSRASGVGGTSLHWGLGAEQGDEGWLARPLDPLDFEARPGLPHGGWPMTRADLEPYYRRAQEVGRLGAFDYALAGVEAKRLDDLGLRAAGLTAAIFQRGESTFAAYRQTLAESAAIRVIHGATVVRLVPDGRGDRVGEVIAVTRPPRRLHVVAPVVVLAAGGIENARLLLMPDPERPAGWGNGHDQVGRCFMERLSARAGVLHPTERLWPAIGLFESHLASGRRIQASLGLDATVVRDHGLRNATFWLRPRSAAFTAEGIGSAVTAARLAGRRPPRPRLLGRHLAVMLADAPAVARAALEARGVLRADPDASVIQLGVQAEQAPNPRSRVTLGRRRDHFGRPVARLDWRPSRDDRHSIVASVGLLGESLRASGLGTVERPFGSERAPAVYVGNWHHLGTTRMDRDPAQGVVDPDGRLHEADNLYVAGSSVFPSGGFANPTLTVIALAIRLADHLRATCLGRAT